MKIINELFYIWKKADVTDGNHNIKEIATLDEITKKKGDIFLQYGAFLTEDTPGSFSNYSALLAPPKMKPYVSVNFREDDGEKLPATLPSPAYEGRDITLYFAIIAETRKNFREQYENFLRLLKSGWLVIYVPELEKRYEMYYKESSAYQQLTTIEVNDVTKKQNIEALYNQQKSNNKEENLTVKLASKFKVVFREPVPAF